MGKSQMALGNELRDAFAQIIEATFKDDYDVLRVPLSAESTSDGYRLAIPTVDSEHNEKTVLIQISIPKGSRDGTPYDPYEENTKYNEIVEANKAKAKAREEKAKHEEEEKARKRAARKTIKRLNTEGLQGMIHSPEPPEALPSEIAG